MLILVITDTYSYDELKIMLEGEMTLKDKATGEVKLVKAVRSVPSHGLFALSMSAFTPDVIDTSHPSHFDVPPVSRRSIPLSAFLFQLLPH